MDESRFLTEDEIEQAIRNIVYDHDCKIIDIKPIEDETGRIVNYLLNIICPKENELECALALDNQLGEFLSEPEKSKEMRTLKGWPV